MKIYTNTFDLSRPSPHRFWVPPYSDFKFGIKLVNAGAEVQNDFTVAAGTTELTPDEDKIDGFTIFTAKSADTGFVEYTIDVADIVQKFKLVQIVTDSTVFEVGGSGGGDVPADVATKSWVNSQISDFVTEDALTAYVTEDWVESQISDFVEEDALTAFVPLSGNVNMTGSLSVSNDFNGASLDASNGVTVWDTDEGKQKIISLDYDGLFVKNYNDTAAKEIEYPTKSGTMLVDADLTAYYTKSETSSATELADAFAGAGGGGAISAYDMSESPVQSKTLVENALKAGSPLPQTIVKYADNSVSVFNVVGNLRESINPTDGRVPLDNATGVVVGTQITCLYDGVFSFKSQLSNVVIPDSVTLIEQEVFRNSKVPTIKVPNSVNRICLSAFATNNATVVDFGNTRTNVPMLYTAYGSGWFSDAVSAYVPDNLYDTWIAANRWSSYASQIHRHSELEAPYLYSSKVAGGAETGATGTPAAVNAVKSVYETDWATLSATADANTFYVVVPDPE